MKIVKVHLSEDEERAVEQLFFLAKEAEDGELGDLDANTVKSIKGLAALYTKLAMITAYGRKIQEEK